MALLDDAALAARDASGPTETRRGKRTNWFAAFWRWHFYGSIIVIPVLLVLTISGMTYMFRAQIDDWTHPGVLTVSAPAGGERLSLAEQEEAVRAAFPDRSILSVTDNLEERATVFVTDLHGESRNVYIDPFRAEVTGDLAPDQLVSDWAERIHGTLLIGDTGDRIVELGASWAIVLTITGFIIFFLGRRPRAGARAKGLRGARLRGTHAVVGLPVGLGILLLVVSGLPWTGVWGEKAQNLAADNGTSFWGADPGAESTLGDLIESADGKSGPAGWAVANGPTAESDPGALAPSGEPSTGDEDSGHAGHGSGGADPSPEWSGPTVSIDDAIAAAAQVGAPGPYFVTYPGDERGVFSVFGWQWSNNGNPAASDVTQELTVHVDQYSGNVVGEYGYDDYSALAKTVSQGIALHEGRRFGAVNTVMTTVFCLAVIFMCISGPVMWWRRRGTASGLAAPRARLPIFGNWLLLIAVAALGVFLPLFGISLIAILLLDQLVIRRVPAMSRYFASA
ncbi:PepSY domain-containing protein [Nocardioides sp. R-C-SC26]|uniref:PepSY-associated TM helix domain-containing protein n=1 Tax=Nocardioides sp. R-C-SC26 TaxID=2870414 RepID=UPI001E3C2B4A|nr:PepSY domain-containing protein [Nocardioides sp. R-C-SC26]